MSRMEKLRYITSVHLTLNRWTKFFIFLNHFPRANTCSRLCTNDFWKQCGKMWNCLNSAFSNFFYNSFNSLVVKIVFCIFVIKDYIELCSTWYKCYKLGLTSIFIYLCGVQSILNDKQSILCIFHPFPPADAFWKHCGLGWNCSWWAISPLASMFSTLCNNYAIFYWNFSGFWHFIFKVVCCRFVVCGKGLMEFTVCFFCIV